MIGLKRKPVERIAVKRKSRFKSTDKSFLPFVVLGGIGLTGINTFLIMSLFGAMGSIATASKTRMIEDPDGNVKMAVALESREPSDEMIRGKVNRTIFSLHNWRGVLPPEDDTEIGQSVPDKGIEIEKGKKIPYLAWKAGFSLKEGFRQEYLKKISTIVPSGVFQSPPTALGIPELREVGLPQKVGKGKWIVTWHGVLGIFNNSNLPDTIPLKYEVHIEQIDSFSICPRLTEEECKNRMDDTQRAIYEQQQDRLLITKLKEIE